MTTSAAAANTPTATHFARSTQRRSETHRKYACTPARSVANMFAMTPEANSGGKSSEKT